MTTKKCKAATTAQPAQPIQAEEIIQAVTGQLPDWETVFTIFRDIPLMQWPESVVLWVERETGISPKPGDPLTESLFKKALRNCLINNGIPYEVLQNAGFIEFWNEALVMGQAYCHQHGLPEQDGEPKGRRGRKPSEKKGKGGRHFACPNRKLAVKICHDSNETPQQILETLVLFERLVLKIGEFDKNPRIVEIREDVKEWNATIDTVNADIKVVCDTDKLKKLRDQNKSNSVTINLFKKWYKSTGA